MHRSKQKGEGTKRNKPELEDSSAIIRQDGTGDDNYTYSRVYVRGGMHGVRSDRPDSNKYNHQEKEATPCERSTLESFPAISAGCAQSSQGGRGYCG